jgi:hypothetical protein
LDGYIAIHFRHPDVGNDQIRLLLATQIDKLTPGGRHADDLMAKSRQHYPKVIANILFIIRNGDT